MVHLTTALDAASGVPLYEQLYRSLAAEMRTGAISAGTRMPGKRRLAAELSVSVNTVDAAYQMLAAEGYLEARERSGFYVQEYLALPERTESAAPPQPEAAPAPEQPVRYDLSTRGVDPELFPFRTWARLQKELLYSSPELLTHGEAQGDLSLRQALAEGKRLLRFDHDRTRRHSPIIDSMGEIFIVENKSLAAYLRQLGKMGEDPEDYASIWAYTHGETEPRFGLYVYPDFGFATTDRVSNLELE